jgi:GDPmannose 4,6-dehydratase
MGWVPEITIEQMIEEMVQYDFAQAKQRSLLEDHGFAVAVSNER